MRVRLHRKLLAAVLAVAIGGLIGGSSILCVGSNGHVALEQVSAHCCSPSNLGGAARAAFSAVEQQRDCGGCTDTQLSATAATHLHESDGAVTPPVSSVGSVEWPSNARDDLTPALAKAARVPRTDLALVLASTISLRC